MGRFHAADFFAGGFFGLSTDGGSGAWTDQEVNLLMEGMTKKKKKEEEDVSYLDRYWTKR